MERVAFLLEETGQTLGCLLNPGSLVWRRTAGVSPRRSLGGDLTGARLADDPLLYTGGGRTELELELLFDVNLAGSSVNTEDVRDLTRPLWELAENATGEGRPGQPPLVRFVWGKAWNLRGVVTSVAERLEQFTPTGTPQRSWLRLRLRRVNEPGARERAGGLAAEEVAALSAQAELLAVPEEQVAVHELLGAGPLSEEEGAPSWSTERLDELAFRYLGNAALWRLLARFNDIDDPLRLVAGLRLRIPPFLFSITDL